jgi:soluble lytic murein transglycosylase
MVGYQAWKVNRFASFIKAASVREGIDALLIKAVIKRESNFDPRARGTKGEIGLMQVTPAVGVEYASAKKLKNFETDDLFNPRLNIDVGTWYLAKALRRYADYQDPLPFALAHYNAGASNVSRWLEKSKNKGDRTEFLQYITYPGTREYIYFVTRWYHRYRFFSL